MSTQTPSIGRIVHYKLSAQDAEAINYARWATSVTAGDGPRQYAWPTRV